MATHEYRARIHWKRDGATFTDNRFSRAHTWHFDGGLEVPASASPHVVRVPMSVEAAVDPEEAFVASLSSCHMLWFLSLAARAGCAWTNTPMSQRPRGRCRGRTTMLRGRCSRRSRRCPPTSREGSSDCTITRVLHRQPVTTSQLQASSMAARRIPWAVRSARARARASRCRVSGTRRGPTTLVFPVPAPTDLPPLEDARRLAPGEYRTAAPPAPGASRPPAEVPRVAVAFTAPFRRGRAGLKRLF
jgi:hypothetical protein